MQTVADSSIKLYFPYTTRQKVGKCLPEIKKEISRKGSSKSAEKVLQINQEKIRNQAVNEKAHPPIGSGKGESCGGFSLLPPKHFVCRAHLQARA